MYVGVEGYIEGYSFVVFVMVISICLTYKYIYRYKK